MMLACSLALTPAFAQDKAEGLPKKERKETIVIRQTTKDGTTVVDIKNGTVYVNGDKVAEAGTDQKVIVSGDEPDFRFSFDEEPRAPKAMLGVMTEPQSGLKGALVRDVTPNSAAEKSGIRKGDVITAVNGKTVKDAKELADVISKEYRPGDQVSVQYQRDGKSRKTDANLMAANPRHPREFRIRPELDRMDMPNMMRNLPLIANEMFEPAPKLGISVEDRADGHGVQVLRVKPGSAAAEAGFREGDVITEMNQVKLGSVDEMQMQLRNYKGGDKLKMQYQRNGRKSGTEVVLPKNLKKKDL